MKKVLCTFGSLNLKAGFPRFIEQAKSLNAFDEILTYSEENLNSKFKKDFGRHLIPYSRGYGYWSWKPWIIEDSLNKLEEGDILLYTDLGCFFNSKGINRLNEYFEMVSQSQIGILGVRSQINSYNDLPETIYYEYEWTKGDILKYFDVYDNPFYTQTTQIEAGVIFFRKCKSSMQFIKEWQQVFIDDFSLVTDKPSVTPNLSGFKENRHDQSIYSILAKKYGISEISTNEIFQRDWSLLENYPIWAMRDKAYSSKFHYKHRFRIRKLYEKWWKFKYLFK